MQIRQEHVEALCSDVFQGFCYIGSRDHLEPFVLKGRSHHVANGSVVIHQQYFMGSGTFGESHNGVTSSSRTNEQCELSLFWKMYKSEQLLDSITGNLP